MYLVDPRISSDPHDLFCYNTFLIDPSPSILWTVLNGLKCFIQDTAILVHECKQSFLISLRIS